MLFQTHVFHLIRTIQQPSAICCQMFKHDAMVLLELLAMLYGGESKM